ncbi:MAG: addiction module toxin, RelE/StbE family [Ignavibacteria bacterium]|nr:addiction module toxin, RelE/StbE family [Ignavibacteria bacterium]
MRELAWHSSFIRAFKKCTKKNSQLKIDIETTLELLQEDPYNPMLKTHKLHGNLNDCWACCIDFDNRIVFTFATNPDTEEEIIALIDIGTHDEVY